MTTILLSLPDGEKSIFTTVIHKRRSRLRQFAHAKTTDEDNVTMSVPRHRVTSQINYDDVTILRVSQKIPLLATMAKWVIDYCFCGIVYSGHKKRAWEIKWYILYREQRFFGHSWCELRMIFTRDFVIREDHWHIISFGTKIVIHGNSCINPYFFHSCDMNSYQI